MSGKPITFEIFGDCSAHIALKNRPHTRAFGMCNWVSLLSAPSPHFARINEGFLARRNLSNYRKRVLRLDAGKGVLDFLFGNEDCRADYLVIDCMDCRKEVIIDRTSDSFSCMTYIRKHVRPEEIFDDSSEYAIVPAYRISFDRYQNAAEIFIREISRLYASDRIIVNRHRPATAYFDEEGSLHHHNPGLKQKHLNDRAMALVEKLEDYIIGRLPGAHVIDWPVHTTINPDHPLGRSALHYDERYYAYYRRCIDLITVSPSAAAAPLLQLATEVCDLGFQNLFLKNDLKRCRSMLRRSQGTSNDHGSDYYRRLISQKADELFPGSGSGSAAGAKRDGVPAADAELKAERAAVAELEADQVAATELEVCQDAAAERNAGSASGAELELCQPNVAEREKDPVAAGEREKDPAADQERETDPGREADAGAEDNARCFHLRSLYIKTAGHLVHLLTRPDLDCSYRVLRQILWGQFRQYNDSYFYGSAAVVNLALSHVLKGPCFLGKRAEQSRIRRQIGILCGLERPEILTEEELLGLKRAEKNLKLFQHLTKTMRRLTFNGHLLPRWLIRKTDQESLPLGSVPNPDRFFRRSQITVTDSQSMRKAVLRRCPGRFFRNLAVFLLLALRLRLVLPSLKRQYRDEAVLRQSRKFWQGQGRYSWELEQPRDEHEL